MKILTVNFLTCAVKACKSAPTAFPLHFRDAVLELVETEFNPLFLINILPRLEWDALKMTATELGFTTLPPSKPEFRSKDFQKVSPPPSDDPVLAAESAARLKVLQDLHTLLVEMQVREGKLVCGNCGHEYKIKEGIANFLLPNHLV
ncbi:hypothetical protein MMC19_000811 [Ptychographa xylographoides]|nr:hypothetical protein [Ptychographa xylographoides]